MTVVQVWLAYAVICVASMIYIEDSRLSKNQTASLFNTGTIMSDGEIYRANAYPIGEYKNRRNIVWDVTKFHV